MHALICHSQVVRLSEHLVMHFITDLTMLQAAKQIVVLESGRVAEVGSHHELTQKGGLYAQLVSMQSLSLSNV
jgi:ABC-type multidrug transport system fused ATPase/permease subunit